MYGSGWGYAPVPGIGEIPLRNNGLKRDLDFFVSVNDFPAQPEPEGDQPVGKHSCALGPKVPLLVLSALFAPSHRGS
jgi:hypothetical protein